MTRALSHHTRHRRGLIAAALGASAAALTLLAVETPARTAQAAPPYSVSSHVASGYTDLNLVINGYRTEDIGVFHVRGSDGEERGGFCLEAFRPHSSTPGAYGNTAATHASGQLDFLAFRYARLGLDNDTAAAAQSLVWFYTRSPRSGSSTLVWADTAHRREITPAFPVPWNALPQMSLTQPVGLAVVGRANLDAAEIRVHALYLEAEAKRGPWRLEAIGSTAVRLTGAAGAIAGEEITFRDGSGAEVGRVPTGADGTAAVPPGGVSADVLAPGTYRELVAAGDTAQRMMIGGTPAALRLELVPPSPTTSAPTTSAPTTTSTIPATTLPPTTSSTTPTTTLPATTTSTIPATTLPATTSSTTPTTTLPPTTSSTTPTVPPSSAPPVTTAPATTAPTSSSVSPPPTSAPPTSPPSTSPPPTTAPAPQTWPTVAPTGPAPTTSTPSTTAPPSTTTFPNTAPPFAGPPTGRPPRPGLAVTGGTLGVGAAAALLGAGVTLVSITRGRRSVEQDGASI